MQTYKLSIEPLSYTNWPTWSIRMRDLLMKEGMWA